MNSRDLGDCPRAFSSAVNRHSHFPEQKTRKEKERKEKKDVAHARQSQTSCFYFFLCEARGTTFLPRSPFASDLRLCRLSSVSLSQPDRPPPFQHGGSANQVKCFKDRLRWSLFLLPPWRDRFVSPPLPDFFALFPFFLTFSFASQTSNFKVKAPLFTATDSVRRSSADPLNGEPPLLKGVPVTFLWHRWGSWGYLIADAAARTFSQAERGSGKRVPDPGSNREIGLAARINNVFPLSWLLQSVFWVAPIPSRPVRSNRDAIWQFAARGQSGSPGRALALRPALLVWIVLGDSHYSLVTEAKARTSGGLEILGTVLSRDGDKSIAAPAGPLKNSQTTPGPQITIRGRDLNDIMSAGRTSLLPILSSSSPKNLVLKTRWPQKVEMNGRGRPLASILMVINELPTCLKKSAANCHREIQ